MANTYSSLCYHLVFSTKNRSHDIKPEIEDRLWAYIGGVARKHNMMALQVGGIEDHIHALVIAPPVYSPSQIAQVLKGDSSKWIHEEFPTMRGFAWAGMDMEPLRSASRILQMSLSTSRINESIIAQGVFRKSI